MKKLELKELKEGMVLGAPIVDAEGIVELLSTGTVLTQRHIDLIGGMGISEIYIKENEKPSQDVALDVESLKRNADKNGQNFDFDALLLNLQEIETHIYEPVSRSIVNRNMEVNVLTGEGDIPIDVRHQEALEGVKDVYRVVKEEGILNLDAIRENVKKVLPDMVRNNDVLMRLNQLEKTDNYTFEHSLRVSIMATMIGKWLGYSQQEILELGEAGLLFDIGKLSLPEYLLNKEVGVTREEYELVKKHAQFGYSILLKTKGVSPNIKYAALHHHERMDGSGYPLRLREGQIHDFAKIIMVCDVFDALITERPYKKAISPLLAADYLSWSSGRLFDAEVCFIFVKKLSEYYIGKKVKLNNGSMGKIVFVDENFPTRPIIQVGDQFVNLIKDRSLDVEILY